MTPRRAPWRLSVSEIRTATDFAEAIVAGEIVAAKPERDACQRHLDDLKRESVFYDYAYEAKVFAFLETLRLEDGEPLVLMDWQRFVAGCLTAWREADSGIRRFRQAYIESAKSSGKSPLVAAVVLHIVSNEPGKKRRGFFAAATEQQAGVAFKDLATIVQNSPALSSIYEVLGRASPYAVWGPKTGAEIKCLPFKATGAGVSGIRPNVWVVDEYHEHKTPVMLNLLERSRKQIPDVLGMVVSNAGPDRKCPCWDEHELGRLIASGEKEVNHRFAYIATTDPGEDPFTSENPSVFYRKANPGYPVMPDKKSLDEQIEDSRGSLSKENSVRRLLFGKWLSDTASFIDPAVWEACEGKLSSEAKRAKVPAFIGVDLSLKRDLTSAAIVWDFGDRYEAEVVSWTPSGSVEDLVSQGQIRMDWFGAGWLKKCPGKTIRFADIARWLHRMYKKFDVKGVAFDPSRFSEVEQQLRRLGARFSRENGEDGLFLVPHSQQAKPPKKAVEEEQEVPILWLGRSLEDLECSVLDGKMRFETNETLRASNEGCAVREDLMGYRAPDKKDSGWKIDPLVALMMATGYASWHRIHGEQRVDWDAIDDLASAWA